MKFKVLLLTGLMFISFGCQSVHALPVKMPQAQTQQLSDEELNEQTTNIFMGFLNSIFKILTGKSNEISVKSSDVRNFSNTVKNYQEQELANNPEYEGSHAQDKTDFGTAILDIIAGILSFFGM